MDRSIGQVDSGPKAAAWDQAIVDGAGMTPATRDRDESYELMPVLKSCYVIMGFTMIGLSFGALYGASWAFTVMGLGYLFLFAVSKQTNIVLEEGDA